MIIILAGSVLPAHLSVAGGAVARIVLVEMRIMQLSLDIPIIIYYL